MDVFWPAVYSALNGDSELDGLTAAVTLMRTPEDPKRLSMPVVVFRPRDASDEPGLHGAATNPEVEIDVWGYDGDANQGNPWVECMKAANRISEVMLTKLNLSSGGHTRFGEIVGWQQIDQPDLRTVLLRATFRCRYWGSGRIAALT